MNEEKRNPDRWHEDIDEFIKRKQEENEALRKFLESLHTNPPGDESPGDELNEEEN